MAAMENILLDFQAMPFATAAAVGGVSLLFFVSMRHIISTRKKGHSKLSRVPGISNPWP